MFYASVFPLLAIILRFGLYDCLECYSCTNVSALVNCNAIQKCAAGETFCYMDVLFENGIKNYTLGCMGESGCQGKTAPSVVGRSTQEDSDQCSRCCNRNNCNRQLCQSPSDYCENTKDYDCAAVGASINICSDSSHAKITCREFCGLCSIQDGGWSIWTPWSTCDVTCGLGRQSRVRSCSDPPPRDGGEDCVGAYTESQNCSLATCPVDGAWSDWMSWSACTRTCDIGMQNAIRTCTNPAPFNGGKACTGGNAKEQLCFPGACADGGWGDWGSWGSCSRSCGDGLRSRTRACDNPPRSMMGKDCPGRASSSELCITTRCNDSNVIFLARKIDSIPSIDVVVFKTIEVNQGGGYDNTTGRFTAPVAGTYSFSAQLCPKDSAVVYQLVHDNKVMGGYFHGTGSGGCVSMSSNMALKKDEQVWVRSYYTGGDVFEDDNSIWNMFTGVLIRQSGV